ncbi:Hypothetical predicted protein, partial [Marmota monax]
IWHNSNTHGHCQQRVDLGRGMEKGTGGTGGRSLLALCSAHRYMAIVHPFQPRLSAPSTKAVIAGIWLVALALAFPQCFYSTITVDQGATKCVVAWPEDSRDKSLLQ